jgi:hypothetical protein
VEEILRHLAQAAAILLFLELFVLLMIFLGISGGLAFGLRWVRGKTRVASIKGNELSLTVRRYVHQGTDIAAKPVIATASAAEMIKATAQSIRSQVGDARRDSPQPQAPPPDAPSEVANTAG